MVFPWMSNGFPMDFPIALLTGHDSACGGGSGRLAGADRQ